MNILAAIFSSPSLVLVVFLVWGCLYPRLGFAMLVVWLMIFTLPSQMDAAISSLTNAGVQP